MSAVILDASAVLAMLKSEPGCERVARVIDTARISAVNYAEVVSYFSRAGIPADAIKVILNPLPLTVVDADLRLAIVAGNLRAKTADLGLSLGDRFCLAQAQHEGLPAWTADKSWVEIAERVGVEVVLIR